MSVANCSEFLNHVDQWVEGQEVAGARDHSRACASCRALADDLATIRLAAITLPESDDDPSPQLWRNLRAELEREGLIHNSRPSHPETVGAFADLFSFVPRPVLAAAYVAALVASGLVLSRPTPVPSVANGWIQRSDSLSAQLQDAEKDEVAALSSLSPSVTDDLRKNLTIVDNDIALCEKSVREQPNNEIARDYLYSAYQQKADLLALISERGDDVR